MRPAPPHLLLITRPDLADSNALFQAACDARNVEFVALVPGRAAEAGLDRLEGPRLLYRAATDAAAIYLEQLLFDESVAAFHDPQFPCRSQEIVLQRKGVATPRKVLLPDPDILESQVGWLGGLPVVVKEPGGEGGSGVRRVGSLRELEETLALAPQGTYFERFVPHRKAYRLLVIGDRVAACTAAAPGPGDFRSNADGAVDLGVAEPFAPAVDLALRATEALRLELGGVDVLESESGELLIAEVNCPCYFVDQQEATGRDLAGEMVDHLLAKSRNRERVA